jgi:hypothetical protein
VGGSIDLVEEDEEDQLRRAKPEPVFLSSQRTIASTSNSPSSAMIDLTSMEEDDEDVDSTVEIVATTPQPTRGKASGRERKAPAMATSQTPLYTSSGTTTTTSTSPVDVTDLSNSDRAKRPRLLGDEEGERSAEEQSLHKRIQEALAAGMSIEALAAALRASTPSSRTSSSFLGAIFTSEASPTPTGRRGRRRILDDSDDDAGACSRGSHIVAP